MIPPLPADQAKALATLAALAAYRHGIEVHLLADDAGQPEIVVTRGPVTHRFRRVNELQAFLETLEGAELSGGGHV